MFNSNRRIQKELEKLATDPISGVSLYPDTANPRHFHVHLSGPDNTPYEGGIFELEIFLRDEYPMRPPKVRFVTKIYHPNVDRLGTVSIDILFDDWSPAQTMRSVLLGILDIMNEPNYEDPLDAAVGRHWHEDSDGAIRTAKEWCFFYASS